MNSQQTFDALKQHTVDHRITALNTIIEQLGALETYRKDHTIDDFGLSQVMLQAINQHWQLQQQRGHTHRSLKT
jgi:hypothetical protein